MTTVPADICGLTPDACDAFVRAVLAEDIGCGDVTTDATISTDTRFSATLSPRQPVIVAGLALAMAFFRSLDPDVAMTALVEDGAEIAAGTPMLRLAGAARPMLAAERSALNTLQHLSGVATLTREYVRAIDGTGCILLDTRKTTPCLRAMEKYAARMGGATNHRMRLDDGMLIKDNHIAAAGGIDVAVRAAKAATGVLVQVEIDTLDQIRPALAAGADRLLCDNMTPARLRDAVALVAGRVPIEASGGIRLDTIRAFAATGVDFVSVGRITQSAPAADIGLDYTRLQDMTRLIAHSLPAG